MVKLSTARCLIAVLTLCLSALFTPNAFATEAKDQSVIINWVAKNSHKSVDVSQATSIVKAAYKAAAAWNIDPLLLLAVMKPESNFQKNARNKKSNASGLMQIIPYWHRDKIGKRQIMQVDTNVDVGAAIIAEYLSLSGGKLQKAITRYRGLKSTTYMSSIAVNYKAMKAALVEDRFLGERPHRTDHIFANPQAYALSLEQEQTHRAAYKPPETNPDKFFAVLVASHP